MALTKARLIEELLTRKVASSRAEAEQYLHVVIEAMKQTLGKGEGLKLSGFGAFVVADKATRQGRNPQTGEPLLIRGRRVVKFKASPVLKDAMNEE